MIGCGNVLPEPSANQNWLRLKWGQPLFRSWEAQAQVRDAHGYKQTFPPVSKVVLDMINTQHIITQNLHSFSTYPDQYVLATGRKW